MEPKTLYKIISGSSAEVERVLNVLAQDDWRPVAMSCNDHGTITVILENKILDEEELKVSNAIAEDTTGESNLEEIQ
jgi:hypothetical protein